MSENGDLDPTVNSSTKHGLFQKFAAEAGVAPEVLSPTGISSEDLGMICEALFDRANQIAHRSELGLHDEKFLRETADMALRTIAHVIARDGQPEGIETNIAFLRYIGDHIHAQSEETYKPSRAKNWQGSEVVEAVRQLINSMKTVEHREFLQALTLKSVLMLQHIGRTEQGYLELDEMLVEYLEELGVTYIKTQDPEEISE